MPKGLQEVSFQLEPQRVVGGRLAPGDHVGIFITLKGGGLEAKPEKETTQLTIHKVLVTAVQRAPVASPVRPALCQPGATAPAEDTSLPTGSTDPHGRRERRGRHQDRLCRELHGIRQHLAEQGTAQRHGQRPARHHDETRGVQMSRFVLISPEHGFRCPRPPGPGRRPSGRPADLRVRQSREPGGALRAASTRNGPRS